MVSSAAVAAAAAREAPARDTVLILSDDADYRRQMTGALIGHGFSVVATQTDVDAVQGEIRALADHNPESLAHAVVLDVTGHPTHGLDTLDAIRRQDWRVPVILLVRNFGGGEFDRRCFGATVVFEGRLDIDGLVDEVVRVAARRDTRRWHGA